MEYKRIEFHVGWTCNQKCTYCIEYRHMESQWNNKVTKIDVLKKLIKYKKQGYNHVTYLGGEPFIQPVFLDALKLGKKMGFTILVTTNATTLHIDEQAKKFLPYIDELILSVEAIDKTLQQNISRTNVFVNWEETFKNIDKYWKGSYLKANIVITKDNLNELLNIVKFIIGKGIKNIAITYPDLDLDYYGEAHLKELVAPTYKDSIQVIDEIDLYCDTNNVLLKIVDFPFCVFPKNKLENFIKKTDEIDYGNRLKIGTSIFENPLLELYELDSSKTIPEGFDMNNFELDRNNIRPRERRLIDECKDCKYNDLCWGPAVNYKVLYGYNEIKHINYDK